MSGVDNGLVVVGGVASPELMVRLRVVLRGVSPLIWRRLAISNDATLADLHEVLQVSFGWSDEHLHRFRIHGGEFGIFRDGGVWFDEDARRVRLDRFELRAGERFVYEYDFGASWVHDIRVEQLRPLLAGEGVPRCVGGARAGPPEECGGPDEFMAWQDSHSRFEVADILSPLAELADFGGDVRVRDLIDVERLETLCDWLGRDRFHRRALNAQLAELYGTEVQG